MTVQRCPVSAADIDGTTDGVQVNPDVGNTIITITVTAANGTTTRTYRVDVYRSPAASTTGGFLQVDVGEHGACALRVDKTMVCWKNWSRGVYSPSSVDGVFVQISTGRTYACATTAAGALKCNDPSRDHIGRIQTDSGAMAESKGAGSTFGTANVWTGCRLNDDGSVYCVMTGSQEITPPSLRTGPYKAVAVGYLFACRP